MPIKDKAELKELLIEAINETGLRDKVKIMIGGGAVDEKVREYSGADAYGPDAVAAVKLARAWTQIPE